MRKCLIRFSLSFALLIPGALLPARADGRGVLRVMTYNIHHGADPHGHLNLRATAAVIRQAGADIIALQEVDRRWGPRSMFRDQAARLALMLNMQYVFGVTRDWRPHAPGRGEFGLAVMSRFPIVAADFRLLPGELEQRGVLLAWVEEDQKRFPVACIHLGLSAADRLQQTMAALSWLPVRPDLILLGDFNTGPQAFELTGLHQQLRDLQEACGLGQVGTFVYRDRSVRIDYAFAGTAWRPLSCQVLVAASASDHYPLLVELSPDDGAAENAITVPPAAGRVDFPASPQ